MTHIEINKNFIDAKVDTSQQPEINSSTIEKDAIDLNENKKGNINILNNNIDTLSISFFIFSNLISSVVVVIRL